MIDIKLESKGIGVSGHVIADGSNKTITDEIYVILKTLSEQFPLLFEDALELHTQELIEKIVDKEIGE